MMQADVRYAQNFSANNADLLKPWMPQHGLRWLELVVRADRADGPEAAALNAVFRPVCCRKPTASTIRRSASCRSIAAW